MAAHFGALTVNGQGLFITQAVRLVFGLYLVFTDWLRFDDPSSALSVLIIYILLGLFTWLFLTGKRIGLSGILVLSTLLILANTVFTFMSTDGTVDAGLHSPQNNPIPTVLRYVFFVITLYFSVVVIRENRSKG